MYAVAIKILVLNCFANLEIQKECITGLNSADIEAVYYCFNTLPATDETVKKVKEKYLRAVITGVTKYTEDEVRITSHVGTMYKQKVEEWIKKKFDEYVSFVTISDFEQLRKDLDADFNKMVKTAEEEGVFEEDDKKQQERMRKFWSSINLKDI